MPEMSDRPAGAYSSNTKLNTKPNTPPPQPKQDGREPTITEDLDKISHQMEEIKSLSAEIGKRMVLKVAKSCNE